MNTSDTKPLTTKPQNNPRTGLIDRGPQGITFRGESLMKGHYAFSPTRGHTQWYRTYTKAKAAFERAAK